MARVRLPRRRQVQSSRTSGRRQGARPEKGDDEFLPRRFAGQVQEGQRAGDGPDAGGRRQGRCFLVEEQDARFFKRLGHALCDLLESGKQVWCQLIIVFYFNILSS